MSKKVHRNDVDFLPIETTFKKVSRKGVDFLLIKITLKKVCQNDADFSPIEITLKKYVKMTWKFVDIFSATYRRNIAIESTLIWCSVSVGWMLADHNISKYLGLCCKKSFEKFSKVYSKKLKPETILKNRHLHTFFPVTFVKFFRRPYL